MDATVIIRTMSDLNLKEVPGHAFIRPEELHTIFNNLQLHTRSHSHTQQNVASTLTAECNRWRVSSPFQGALASNWTRVPKLYTSK